MQYGYFLGNEMVAPVPMCPRFNDIGAWHTLSDEERAVHGWHPCVIQDEEKDERLHLKLPADVAFDAGVFKVTYSYIPKGIYQVMEEKLDVLNRTYEDSLNKDFLLLDNYYRISHLSILQDCMSLPGDDVFLDVGLIRKLPREDADEIYKSLSNLKVSLLEARFEVQTLIKNSLSPEEVICVDIQERFNKILE